MRLHASQPGPWNASSKGLPYGFAFRTSFLRSSGRRARLRRIFPEEVCRWRTDHTCPVDHVLGLEIELEVWRHNADTGVKRTCRPTHAYAAYPDTWLAA